jgi:arginase
MVKSTSLAFIAAPTNLGLSRHPDGRERGCDKLPQALADHGFLEHIGAFHLAELSRPSYPPTKEYYDKTLNARQVHPFTCELATVVGDALDAGHFPIVAGGDCSVLVGCTLALARRGRYGLSFLDAHVDYFHPDNCEGGVVAGMDLALVTGRGTPLLTTIDGLNPYIREEDVVVLGYRLSNLPFLWMIEEVKRTRMRCIDIEAARQHGFKETMDEALEGLRKPQLAGVWLHLDADILDASIMSAVDCPEVDGLFEEELTQILACLLKSDLLVGMNLTILDPDLDPEGKALQVFTRSVSNAFRELASGQVRS